MQMVTFLQGILLIEHMLMLCRPWKSDVMMHEARKFGLGKHELLLVCDVTKASIPGRGRPVGTHGLEAGKHLSASRGVSYRATGREAGRSSSLSFS